MIECGYCHKLFKKRKITKDHMIPSSRGGITCEDNIILCCVYCNNEKDNMTYEEYMLFLERAESLSVSNRKILRRYYQIKADVNKGELLKNERIIALNCILPYVFENIIIDNSVIDKCTNSEYHKNLIYKSISGIYNKNMMISSNACYKTKKLTSFEINY